MMMADRDGHCGKSKDGRKLRGTRDPLAAKHRSQHQHETNCGAFEHFAGTPVAQIKAHEKGDGHGGGNGERSPRAAHQCVHDNQRHHGQKHDHDHQHRDQRNETANFADFIPRHLAHRLAIAAHGCEKDDEILHGAAEHSPAIIQSVPGR